MPETSQKWRGHMKAALEAVTVSVYQEEKAKGSVSFV
jgi:hypothetical protein